MPRPERIPGWFILTLLASLAIHAGANAVNTLTINLMRSTSDFAVAVSLRDRAIVPYFRGAAFLLVPLLITFFLWPVLRYFRDGATGTPSRLVERRVIDAPIVISALGFAPYLVSVLFFPLLTISHFGRWSPELSSPQIWSPLVSGFLATTTTYLILDLLFRARVVPKVFPRGRLADTGGTLALGVRAQLLIFLLAVAFTPLFTVLGLVRAAERHLAIGASTDVVVRNLISASQMTFAFYVGLGLLLTLLLARSLTRPLAEAAATLRRVQGGDLDAQMRVVSSDEVGILADGVNAMVSTLRDRERILATFGRVVEPAIRDRLLAGDLSLGGELRTVSVLFCDLHGFTGIAERVPPKDVVSTLNEFFSEMTDCAKLHAGFVDKFIGDAVMVVFGLASDTPIEQAAAAAAALSCVIEMRQRLASLNQRRSRHGSTTLGMSIGVHSGEVVAGIIGARERYEYTVIGDTVNVASRLQQVSRDQNLGAVISDDTYRLARSAGFRCTEPILLDAVQLRGRSEAVRVLGLA
jgi:adenylate cyclase